VHHTFERDLALVGAAPDGRDVGAHTYAGFERRWNDLTEDLERRVDGLVDVHLVVRLARGEKDGDLAQAHGQRALEPLLVGHERAQPAPFGSAEALHQLGGVGELRHPLRRDEARDLDAREPRIEQRAHQALLAVERDHHALVLQPVARADLDDADAVGLERERIVRGRGRCRHALHRGGPCFSGQARGAREDGTGRRVRGLSSARA
jgi:hypothetical protein